MFFPFEVKYKSYVSSSNDVENILRIIEDSLLEERGKYQKTLNIGHDYLGFSNSFMSRNIFHSIWKGKFLINTNGTKKYLVYKFYMEYYFCIYIIFGTLVAFVTNSFFSKGYLAFYFYLLLIWIGTMISQKLFFNKIIKRINR